jgi:hypothetical protein
VQLAESSASRIRQQGSARDDGGAQGQEASVHTGGAMGQPANQGRTPIRERILETRGGAGGGRLPPPAGRPLRQPRGSLLDAGTPEDPCVQPGDLHGECSPALLPAHLDRQVHGGDRPTCMAQRLPPGLLAGRCHH